MSSLASGNDPDEQSAANQREYPFADFCEATDMAVLEYEERTGDDGCPLCGFSASSHRKEEA